jgi:DNA-binding protein HU-beta
MNKAAFIAVYAEKMGSSKAEAERALNAFMESVSEVLSKHEKITMVGFGTFEVLHKPERKGTHPRTLEEITIPAKNVPVFKAGKELKDIVK